MIDFFPLSAIYGSSILYKHLGIFVGPGTEGHCAAVNDRILIVVGFQDFEVLPWRESIILNLQLQFILILRGGEYTSPPIGTLADAIRTLTRILHANTEILPKNEVLHDAIPRLPLHVGFGLTVHLVPPSQELINLQVGHLLDLGAALVLESGIEPDEQRD